MIGICNQLRRRDFPASVVDLTKDSQGGSVVR
jgi:hypothetical protein